MVEIAAVQGQANATLIAGYGFTGILVSFIARHHPLGIIPAAILFGGLGASGAVLQRHLNVPDASVQVLMGILFVTILLFRDLVRATSACSSPSRSGGRWPNERTHPPTSGFGAAWPSPSSAAPSASAPRSSTSASASASRRSPAGSTSAWRGRW